MSAIVNATSPFAYASPLGRLLDKDLALRFSACLAALRAAQCRTGSLDTGSVCGSAPIDAKDLFYNIFRYLCSSGGGTPFYVPFDVAQNGTPNVEGQIKNAQPYRVWWSVFNRAIAYLLSESNWCLAVSPSGRRLYSIADIPAVGWKDFDEAADYAYNLDNHAPWLCTAADIDFGAGFFGSAYSAPHGGGKNAMRSAAASMAAGAGFTSLFPAIPTDVQIAAWGLSFSGFLPSYWRGDTAAAVQDGTLKQLSSADSSGFRWRDEFPYHGLCALVAALDYFETARGGVVWATANYSGYDNHYIRTTLSTSYYASATLNYDSKRSDSPAFVKQTSSRADAFFASRAMPYVRRTLQNNAAPNVVATAALPTNVALATGVNLSFVDAGDTYIVYNALAQSVGFFSGITAASTADDIAALINMQIDAAVESAYGGSVNVSVGISLTGSMEDLDRQFTSDSDAVYIVDSSANRDVPDGASMVAFVAADGHSAVLKVGRGSVSAAIYAQLRDEAGGQEAPSPSSADLSCSVSLEGSSSVLPYNSHVSVVFDYSRRLKLYQTAGEASSATPYVEIPMPVITDEFGVVVFPTGREDFGRDFSLRITPGARSVPVSVSVNASGDFDSFDVIASLKSLSAFYSNSLPARQIAAPGYY